MPLKDIQYKSIYEQTDDVLNNFYIPSFNEATFYKRASAYFSTNSLKLYAKGLSNFVSRGGKIQFIFSHQLSESDFETIKTGYNDKFNNQLMDEINDLKDSPSICNLAYLISKGIVEVKIGFIENGLFHFKFGLFKDDEDTVCFRGSSNETAPGILLNGENFEVSCSWEASEKEKEKIEHFENDFNKMWNNTHETIRTVLAPKCVVEKIASKSKGNIIHYEEKDESNLFILDFDNNDALIGYSFLENKSLLAPSTIFFKTKIQSFVESIDNLEIFRFRTMRLNEIKSLIKKLQDYADKMQFNFRVSARVLTYIQNIELHLEKRKSLGIAIKQREDTISNEFKEFKEIVDKELSRELKEPQMWDAFHAAHMVAASNFSVPGTGKTTIAYGTFGYLSSAKNGNKIKRLIMIGPKNSFMAWKNEFGACFGDKRQLRCFNVQDPMYKNTNQRVANLIKKFNSSNLILINYDMLMNKEILDTLISLLKQSKFSDFLVLDEAHKIKGIDGKRASAVLSIVPYIKYKLVLTGTPIPNTYKDIYNMLNLLYGDEYNDFFGFSQNTLLSASYNDTIREQINEKFYPFFCRTTKDDLNIPKATFDYKSGLVEMNEVEEKAIKLTYDNFSQNRLVLYIRLLQAATNPRTLCDALDAKEIEELLSENDAEDNDKNDDKTNIENFKKDIKFINDLNSKLINKDKEFLMSLKPTRKFYRGIELIEEITNKGEPVVAWGCFVSTLALIESELKARNISCIVISGSMPLDEREKNIEKFINGHYEVLISNPHTLAESISLHRTCHNAVYFEYSFNLTHLLQSRDRIHRLGIPDGTKTNYYFLALDKPGSYYNAIDVKTMERLKFKEEQMLKAVETKHLYLFTEDFKADIDFLFKR